MAPDPNRGAAVTANPIVRWGRALASTRIFCWSLLWLMVLLVLGSVAQKYVGLHQAQLQYFSSWVLWASFIPLPGGRLVMTVVFVNLLAKLVFTSPWRWRRAGVIIAHLGSLLLLVGGFITAYQSVEGYMLIPEGEQRGFFEDHHAMELTVIRPAGPGPDEVMAFAGGFMEQGRELPLDGGGLLIIEELHENCEPVNREGAAPDGARGAALTSRLRALAADPDGRNLAGALLRVSGIDPAADGLYLAMENVSPTRVRGTAGEELLHIELRPRRYRLPFEIRLDDFEMSKHPGTEMARDYRAHVTVLHGTGEQEAEIWMNHPLRAEGYTFYQSSYIDGARQATVLSVVRNAGRLFPYVSSIIICAGMLVHLAIIFVETSRRRRRDEETEAAS